MTVKELTCIECPIGCALEVKIEDGKVVSVSGNGCPRGKMYAENEVICPRRVLTTSVRADNDELIPVKTDRPIKKSDIFAVMEKINTFCCKTPVKLGDVLIENVSEDIHVIATADSTL